MVLEISKNKLQLPCLSNFFRKKNKEETADMVTTMYSNDPNVFLVLNGTKVRKQVLRA